MAVHDDRPGGVSWTQPSFAAEGWKTGPGGFGTDGTPGATIGTRWDTADIWVRRQVTIPNTLKQSEAQLVVYHDEDVQIYINGVLAASETGFNGAYQPMTISEDAKAFFEAGCDRDDRGALSSDDRRSGFGYRDCERDRREGLRAFV